MNRGIIKSIDFGKGLGYVINDQGREIVLIAKGLEQVVNSGMSVTFDIRQTRVGVIAVNIHPLSGHQG